MTLAEVQTRAAAILKIEEAARLPILLNLRADVLASIAEGTCESPTHCAAAVMGKVDGK